MAQVCAGVGPASKCRRAVPYARCRKAVGLYLVRNEVDLIGANLRHHLSRVVDEAIVIDNGSSDGTLELLADLAEDLPIQLASEVGHTYQAKRVTRMVRFAAVQGVDWVLPIDADEFRVGTGACFRDVLEEAPRGDKCEIARHDVSTAREFLGPGGIVAFGGLFSPHQHGLALAVWELVLSGAFAPLCTTGSKLYGSWDEASAGDRTGTGTDPPNLGVRRSAPPPGPAAGTGR